MAQQAAMTAPPVKSGWTFALGWVVTSLAIAFVYWHVVQPALRCWPGMLTHGDPARHTIALTFDDGPHPLWAPLLADTLERHDARGTFCLVGLEAEVYPEITARLVRGGHQVVSHSMTHPYPNLTAFPPARITHEVRDASQVFTQFTGQPIRDFRPPGGGINAGVIAAVKHEGMHIAWWSANAADSGDLPVKRILARVRMSLRPGVVILLHERENTVAAMERFFTGGHGDYRYQTFSEVTRQ